MQLIDAIAALAGAQTETEALAITQAALVGFSGHLYCLDSNLGVLTSETAPWLPSVKGGAAWQSLVDRVVWEQDTVWVGVQVGVSGAVIHARVEAVPELLPVLASTLVLVLARLRAEERQNQARSILHQLTEAMPFAIILSSNTGELMLGNRRLTELTGWTLGELQEKGWFEAMYPDPVDRARAVASVRASFGGKPALRSPWKITHKNGTPTQVLLTSQTIRAANNQYILGILEPSGEPLPTTCDIGRFATVVGHDLHNLIAAVQGHTEMLGQVDIPLVKSHVHHIQAALLRSSRLTTHLAAFAPLQLRPTPTSLQAACKQAIHDLQSQLSILPQLIAPETTLEVDLDFDAFRLLLQNLLSNAQEATSPTDGRILIALSPVDQLPAPRLTTTRSWVRLRVEDNGPGISPEVKSTLFAPFVTTRPGHNGLGLSAVFRLTEAQGGFVDTPSCCLGACFDLYLPLSQRPSPQPALLADFDTHGTERIWVLDDDDDVRDYLVSALSAFGYHVSGFNSAEALLSVLAPGTCDLLVTDILMPEQSGLDLYLTIRSKNYSFPVLFCSGWADRPLPVGRDVDFLQKPFPIRTLAGRVRKLLNYTIPQA